MHQPTRTSSAQQRIKVSTPVQAGSRPGSEASQCCQPHRLYCDCPPVAARWQDEHNNHRLELIVPDAPAQLARGDVDALAIALRNLIENALRYSDGARVQLEVALPCTLVVRDFGPGVAPAQLQLLKQRHVRLHDDQAGYGLGLSIVSTIAQQHEADFELLSPPAGAAHGLQARLVLHAA